MNTQTRIDLRDARALAADLYIACTIEHNGVFVITMDTGEVEISTGLPGVCRILQEYAAAAANSGCEFPDEEKQS